jgi:hypothetical protein
MSAATEAEARSNVGRLMKRNGGPAYLHNVIRVPVLDQHGRPVFDADGDIEMHDVPDRIVLTYDAQRDSAGGWWVVERWRSHPQAPRPNSVGAVRLMLSTCAALLAPPSAAAKPRKAANTSTTPQQENQRGFVS